MEHRPRSPRPFGMPALAEDLADPRRRRAPAAIDYLPRPLVPWAGPEPERGDHEA